MKNVSRVLIAFITYLVSRCVSISAFASLVGIPIGITSCAIRLKICLEIEGMKKYKSKIKNKKKKHDEIILLAKSKLNSTEFFIPKALIDLNISRHDEMFLINNALKEFHDI